METKAESFCIDHCMCLFWSSSKENFDKVSKELKNSVEQYRKELKKLRAKVFVSFEMGFNPQEKQGMFKIDLFPEGDRGILEEKFLKPFSTVQKVIDTLTHYKIEKLDGTSCTKFVFNPKVFRIVGELVLPADITLRSDLTKKLGMSQLSGLMIGFKESPIGISKVEIEFEKENLTVRVITDYKLVTLEDMIMKAYIHSKQVANLFMEEKK